MKNNTTKEIQEVDSVTVLFQNLNLEEGVTSPLALTLMFLVSAGVLCWSYFTSHRLKGHKHKLARAKWAGKKEKRNAMLRGCQQIEKGKPNPATLFISSIELPKPIKIGQEYFLRIPRSPKILYLTDANRGTLVLGSPGSGKTYSFIDPAIMSAIKQGFPIMGYDNKYGLYKSQTARLAGFALEHGYKVWVIAPGFAESAIVNLLDLIPSKISAELARQLAVVLNKNFKLGGDKGNPFFTNAAQLLSQGGLQATKSCSSQYQDILMCCVILALDNLPQRVKHSNLNTWVKRAFAQFIQTSNSPETAASIAGTTLGLFTRFLVPELLPTFIGESTVPLDLTGRQMVIFGMDDEKREVVAPLLASIFHMMATRNLATQRDIPLVLSLDELPTIFLPSLGDWLNQKRDNGLVAILGAQNLSQLEKSYGKEGCETIFTGCSTKAFFNAGSEKAAKTYSEYIGREEVVNKKVDEKITGKSGKTQLKNTPDIQSRPLFEPSQFNTLDTGRAVIISPGFKSGNEASLPLLEKIKISKKMVDKIETQCIKRWYEYRDNLRKNSKLKPVTEEDLKEREAEAERLLPLPLTQEQMQKAADLLNNCGNS